MSNKERLFFHRKIKIGVKLTLSITLFKENFHNSTPSHSTVMYLFLEFQYFFGIKITSLFFLHYVRDHYIHVHVAVYQGYNYHSKCMNKSLSFNDYFVELFSIGGSRGRDGNKIYF